MPKVAFTRFELAYMLNRYRMIRHCLAGAETVKKHKDLYLPRPNASDKSALNRDRYEAYLKRAVFYNVTGRTLAGLVGQVMSRSPVSEIPDALDIVEQDATGGGVTMEQCAGQTLAYTLAYGRSGVLVDYPTTDGAVTALQVANGNMRPTLSLYDPESIINWRTYNDGAQIKLSVVVLCESWPFHDDGFEIKTACQFRVLRLDATTKSYVVDIWREPSPTSWTIGSAIPTDKNFVIAQTVVPLDPNGNPFNEIPFMFVGSRNNDANIDNPPLYDLADLNIAHYRNSADYEEACYALGQPTYWFSGLTEAWVKDILGGTIKLGSMGGILLPPGGTGGLLQPLPNTMVREAMDAKERQMVALGARLVEQQQVQRTATEATQESTSEMSVLSMAARNVSSAYEWALAWCGRFMGMGDTLLQDGAVEYDLNSDFQFMGLSSQDRAEIIKEWQSGAISFSEMRAVLRKVGVATDDDATAQAAIAQEQAAALAQAQSIVGTQNQTNNGAE